MITMKKTEFNVGDKILCSNPNYQNVTSMRTIEAVSFSYEAPLTVFVKISGYENEMIVAGNIDIDPETGKNSDGDFGNGRFERMGNTGRRFKLNIVQVNGKDFCGFTG